MEMLPSISRTSSGRPGMRISGSLPSALAAQQQADSAAQAQQLAAVERNYKSLSRVLQNQTEELTRTKELLRNERGTIETLTTQLVTSNARGNALADQVAELKALPRQIEDLQQRLDESGAASRRQEDELDTLRSQLSELSSCLQAERKQSAQLQVVKQRASDDEQVLRRRVQGLEHELQQVRASEALLRTQLSSATAAADRAFTEASASASRLAEVESRLTLQSSELLALQGSARKLSLALEEKAASESALRVQLEVSHANTRVAEATAASEAAKARTADAQAEEARAALAGALSDKERLEERVTKAQREIDHVNVQLEAANARFEELVANTASTDSQMQSLAHELTQTQALLAESRRALDRSKLDADLAERTAARKARSAAAREAELRAQAEQERAQSTAFLSQTYDYLEDLENRLLNFQEAQQGTLDARQATVSKQGRDLDHRFGYWQQSVETLAGIVGRAQGGIDTVAAMLEHAAASASGKSEAEAALQRITASHFSLKHQLLTSQTRAQDAEARLQRAAAEHESATSQMATEFEIKLQEQTNRLRARLAGVETELEQLKESSALELEAARRSYASKEDQRAREAEAARRQLQLEQDRLASKEQELKGQLAIVSRESAAELRLQQEEWRAELAAAEQRRQELRGQAALAFDTARELSRDVSHLDKHLLKIGVMKEVYDVSDRIPGAEGGDGIGLNKMMGLVRLHFAHVTEHVQELAKKGFKVSLEPKERVTRTIFPAFSEQERTLRNTLDKLVHVEESLETNYTCLMCLRVFEDPVACVPCGHTYCRRCLESTGAVGHMKCQECSSAPVVKCIPVKNLEHLAAKFDFKIMALRDLQALCRGVEQEVVG